MEQYEPLWNEATINALAVKAIDKANDEARLSPHKEFGDIKRDYVKFTIPKFQRGLRWNNTKRKSFAKSLRAGRPIGTLTFALVTEESTGETKTFYVLDGQQRIAALSLIIEGFWKDEHWTLTGRDERAALEILDSYFGPKETYKALKRLLESSDHKHQDLHDHQFLFWLCTDLEKDLPDPQGNDYDELISATNRLREALRKQLDGLEKYPVSAQIIDPGKDLSDSEERQLITDVFVNLNSNVKLSKNELLAAAWEQTQILWPPTNLKEGKKAKNEWELRCGGLFDEMKQRIEKSYEDLEDEFEFEPDVEIVTEENVSLYDWLYALSVTTSLSGNFDGSSSLPAFDGTQKVEELAFDTLSMLITGSNTPKSQSFKEAFEIHFLRDSRSQKFQVNKFQNAYFEAAEAIDRTLSPIRDYGSTQNDREKLGKIAATTYLSYYIALTRNTKYWELQKEPKNKGGPEGKSNKQRREAFLKNLKGWWLLDVLEGDFVGSEANQKAQDRVWAIFDKNPDLRQVDEAMLAPIDMESLAQKLVQVFIDEWSPPSKSPQRRAFSRATKVVHMACFSLEKLNEKLELDHLVAWKNVKGKRPPDTPLPLNHVANYAPVLDKINNARKNKPWAEHFEKLSNAEQETIRRRLLLPPEEFTAEARTDIKKFYDLLHRRWVAMVFKIFNAIDNPDWEDMGEGQAEFLFNKVSEPIRKEIQRTYGYGFNFSEDEVKKLIKSL